MASIIRRFWKKTENFTVRVDGLAEVIARWLRWRGHSLPINVFVKRLEFPAGALPWRQVREQLAQVGIHATWVADRESLLEQREFPIIVVIDECEVRLLRGIEVSGTHVWMEEGACGDVVALEKSRIIGWLQLEVDAKILRRHIANATPGADRAWFMEPFRANRMAYIQAAIVAALINVLTIFASMYSMQVYDRAIPSGATNTLTVLTVGVLLVYVFDLVLRTLRAEVIDRAAKNLDLSLSETVFQRAVGVRMDMRPAHLGTFISQLREHEPVRDFFVSATIFVLSDAPFLVLFLAMIWFIGDGLVLIPLVAIPVILLFCIVVQIPLSKLSMERIKESQARSGLLIEAVEGAETIKTLNAGWRVGRKWSELSILLNTSTIKISAIQSFTANFMATAQQVIYVTIVAYGAVLIQRGDLTSGALIACSILAQRATSPLSQLVGLISRVYQVRASMKSLDYVMSLPTDHKENFDYLVLEKKPGVLGMANVEFSYLGSDVPALKIRQLQVAPGERIAILGRTGSGKSTLLKLFSGLYPPSLGRVSFNDVDVQHIDPTAYRETVGYLTQDVRLFAGTLRENLLLAAGVVNDEHLLEVCRVTGLNRLIVHHPRGLDLPIYEGGGGLSGGQRQAVGLARLLLAAPKIYLLDEPTASMDETTEREFIQQINKHIDHTSTVIMVTHKLSVLPLVDRVIVIEQGLIVLDGARDQVLAYLASGGVRTPGKT